MTLAGPLMKPHERAALRFLLRHLVFGVAGGFAFGIALLATDTAHLRSLIAQSEEPLLWLLMMFFGLFITFGSVGMGVGIMSLGKDDF